VRLSLLFEVVVRDKQDAARLDRLYGVTHLLEGPMRLSVNVRQEDPHADTRTISEAILTILAKNVFEKPRRVCGTLPYR